MGNKIGLVFFDIDGVLTDGMVYVDEMGNEVKSFRLTEIDAINDIKKCGYRIVAITGEESPIVNVFEKRINWDCFVKGCKNKLDEVKRISEEYGMKKENICYIGDGKYDLQPIIYAGLGVCPGNAIRQVKEIADVVLDGRGGDSCIQELCQLLTDICS